MSQPHIESVSSGNTTDSDVIAHFKSDMVRNVKSLVAIFSPVQSGSGDPSPSNIRPITGHTGLTVKQVGVNFVKNTFGSYNGDGLKITPYRNADGIIEYYVCEGVCTKASNFFLNLNYANNTHTWPPYNSNCAAYTYSDKASIMLASLGTMPIDRYNKRLISTEWLLYDNIQPSGSTVEWYRLQAIPYNCNGVDMTTIFYPMVCLQQDAGCEFEPYKGREIAVSWDSIGAIFGGHVDIVKGELVQTHANIASYDGEVLPGKWISDRDVYSEDARPTIGAQVVYELATPITHRITPQTVSTLKGVNNIWTDSGKVRIKYWSHLAA